MGYGLFVMKLRLVWIGKTRDRRLAELIDDYQHRLSRYVKCEVCELREARSSREPAAVLEAEAIRLLEAASSSGFKIALDERGKQFSSQTLAQTLERRQVDGMREIAFVIGGHFGLSERVKESADEIWSLSQLTFTHETARLLLIEQLYRAYTIIHGHPYQK